MEKEIKICFAMYCKYMMSIIKLDKNYTDEIINNMTIDNIKTDINIINMKYIIGSVYSISESSIAILAYKHIKSLIDEHNTINKITIIDNNYLLLKNRLDELEKQKSLSINEKEQLKQKGWLF